MEFARGRRDKLLRAIANVCVGRYLGPIYGRSKKDTNGDVFSSMDATEARMANKGKRPENLHNTRNKLRLASLAKSWVVLRGQHEIAPANPIHVFSLSLFRKPTSHSSRGYSQG